MPDLSEISLADVVSCAAALRNATAGAGSLEATATAVVRSLRAFFVDPESGHSQLVLARLFSTERLVDLPVQLQQVAGQALGAEADSQLRCEASRRYLPGAAGVEVGGDWYDLIDLSGAGRPW